MKKSVKIWLAAAAVLTVVGIAGVIGVIASVHKDYSKLSTAKYETKVVEIGEDFSDIEIISYSADVEFLLADDGVCKVECYEQEKLTHPVSVEGNTLVIREADTRKWIDNIDFSFTVPQIAVYLPETEYNSLKIGGIAGDVQVPDSLSFKEVIIDEESGQVKCNARTDSLIISTQSGDVQVSDIKADTVKVKSNAGEVELKNVTAAKTITADITAGEIAFTGCKTKNIEVNTDSGDVHIGDTKADNIKLVSLSGDFTLSDTVASDSLTASLSTGDITLNDCDAENIEIVTQSGDVSGNLLSGKNFDVVTANGYVDVPGSTDGGKCKIKTDSGDIDIDTD